MNQRIDLLEQIERGEVSVDQVLSALENGPEPVAPPPAPRPWVNWWLIPLTVGAMLAMLGVWLATLGGWWWLAAAPALVIGFGLTFLASITARSPWLHVRVSNPRRAWPKTVGISLPVPARFTAKVLEAVSPLLQGNDAALAAQALVALSENSDEPLHMNLVDGDDRIEIYLG